MKDLGLSRLFSHRHMFFETLLRQMQIRVPFLLAFWWEY